MKKILVASANPWAFALAAERHIIRSHSADRVDLLNMFTLCSRFSPIWRRRDRQIELVNRKIQRFVRPIINGREITGQIDMSGLKVPVPVATPGQVRSYRIGDAAIGLGVLSTVSSVTTIREPEQLSDYGPAFLESWETAHRSWWIGEAVREMGYDQVYIFNGRVDFARPFSDVIQKTARVTTYEQGGTGQHYIMADGQILEPQVFARVVQDHTFDLAAGEEFYLERIHRKPGNEASFFTEGMKTDHIPEGLERGSYVAFYPSSSDELAFIRDDPFYGEFATQFEVAHELARICKDTRRKLVIRLHPHLQHKNQIWRREWDFNSLDALDVFVIPPEDPCDSYALSRGARCVVTCGSTVSFESTFMGVPNAVVGEAVGNLIGASARVMTRAELRTFVDTASLPERAKEQALIYGSFNKVSGTLLEELDTGRHPNFARIDGKIVDPVRAAVQLVRELSRRRQDHSSAGFADGKVIVLARK
jgi:hypothetical protein